MKRLLTLLFCLALLSAKAGVPYVINYGNPTNVVIGGNVTATNLNGPSRLVAILKYVPIEDLNSASGFKDTTVGSWSNIVFQGGAVIEGSYNTNGIYTVASDGILKITLTGVIDFGSANGSPPAGSSVLAGINGVSFYDIKTIAGTLTNLINATTRITVFKGDLVRVQLQTTGDEAAIGDTVTSYAQQNNPVTATLEFTPAASTLSSPQLVFQRIATNVLATDTFTYTGGTFNGTNGWRPANNAYPFCSGEDTVMAMANAPSLFTAGDLLNMLNQMAALQTNNAGLYEGNLLVGGKTGTAVGTNGHVSVTLNFLDVAYSHYKKTGSTSAFVANQTAISNALASVYVTNHLSFIRTNFPASAYAFEDSIAVYGYNLMCSLRRYRDMAEMADILTSLGSDASYYVAEQPLIATNLYTYLWDSSTNLFHAGTISNTVQYSVMGTAYAVVVGAGSAAQLDAAATTLDRMLPWNTYGLAGKGCVKYGAIRHMPEGQFWTTFRGSPITAGSYQNGSYWPVGTMWLARAVQRISQSDADALMGSLAWRYQTEPQNLGPFECEISLARVSATQYLESALNPLGYYKTTDTNR